MLNSDQPTKTVPGKAFGVKIEPIIPANAPYHVTSGTVVASFETVKHLLSNKPLGRPNRTRPIS
jgi:hypothetical protein